MGGTEKSANPVQVIETVPLTRVEFSLYGDVIETEGATNFPINGGDATRFDDLAHVDTTDSGGRPAISIFRSAPASFPVELHMMERHPLASQAIIPMNRTVYLIAVAAAGGFDPALVRVFLAHSGQGVNYGRGVWHHPLITLYRAGDFLVVDRKGEGNNCDVVELDSRIRVAVMLSEDTLP